MLVHFSIPVLGRMCHITCVQKYHLANEYMHLVNAKYEEYILNNIIFTGVCFLLGSYGLVFCVIYNENNLKMLLLTNNMLLTLISKYRFDERRLIFYSVFFMLFQYIINNRRTH